MRLNKFEGKVLKYYPFYPIVYKPHICTQYTYAMYVPQWLIRLAV